MILLRNIKLKDYTSIPFVWMVFILLLGFVIGSGHVDAIAIKEGQGGLGNSAKLIRAATVAIVFVYALYTLIRSGGLSSIARGSNGWLLVFFLLCVGSTVFSAVRSLTLYKSFEILTVLLMVATVYTSKDHYETSKKAIFALLFFYAVTTVGVYLQFAIFGSAGQRQLVGVTPLFGFMLISKYPGMVGNALGYLGAVVALFGMYLLSTTDRDNKKRRFLGMLVFALGAGVTFFSYTRSIMVFLFVAVFLFSAYKKKYFLNVLMILLLIVPLGIPQVRDKVFDHMRRGASDEAISSLSGRTEMWSAVFERSTVKILIGEGYATGSKFMNYDKTKSLLEQANMHNGFLEVVMSIGILGGLVWLGLLIRLCMQFYTFYSRTRNRLTLHDGNFHIFMMALLFLSLARSLMNSTFVYLDYFYPLLLCFIIYGESLKLRTGQVYRRERQVDNAQAEVSLVAPRDGYIAKRKPQVLARAKRQIDLR